MINIYNLLLKVVNQLTPFFNDKRCNSEGAQLAVISDKSSEEAISKIKGPE
jgi:hypothetical protein